WLFLGTWVCGLLLLTTDSSIVDERPPRWLANVFGYAVISLALWVVFAAFHVAWLTWKPVPGDTAVERARDIAAHVANTASFLYLFVFCVIGLAVLPNLRPAGALAAFSRRSRWWGVLYVVLLIGAVPVVVVTNLNGARADAFAKLGSFFERDGQLE